MLLKGYLFIIISAICSGILPIFLKMGYKLNLTLDTMLGMRFFLAAVFLVAWLGMNGRVKFSNFKNRLPGLALQGVLYFGFSVCYMASAKYLPAALVSILFYLFPTIVVLIMTVFYREAMSAKRFIAMVFTFSGCLMVIDIFNQQAEFNWWGIALGLGSALCFAIYNVWGQKLTRQSDPVVVTSFVMLVCSLCVMVTSTPVDLLNGQLTLNQWLIGLAMAIISSVISALCYLKGLSALGASRASILSTLEPAFTIFIAWLFLGERLSLVQMMGGISIIWGIIILQTEKVKVCKDSKTRTVSI